MEELKKVILGSIDPDDGLAETEATAMVRCLANLGLITHDEAGALNVWIEDALHDEMLDTIEERTARLEDSVLSLMMKAMA